MNIALLHPLTACSALIGEEARQSARISTGNKARAASAAALAQLPGALMGWKAAAE